MAVSEHFPDAGACVVSTNVLSGAGRVRWMVRDKALAPVDSGWRILSEADTEEYLSDPENLTVVELERACEIEPTLTRIWGFPVGADLQIVRFGTGVCVVDSHTGAEVVPWEGGPRPPVRGEETAPRNGASRGGRKRRQPARTPTASAGTAAKGADDTPAPGPRPVAAPQQGAPQAGRPAPPAPPGSAGGPGAADGSE